MLLLVASETGHVYTFATRKLQPMITSETGKALIQTCLNSPDSPPRSDPTTDQRMSATGFEEPDLTYQVSESDSSGETKVCCCGHLCKGREEKKVPFLSWPSTGKQIFLGMWSGTRLMVLILGDRCPSSIPDRRPSP